MGQGIGESVHEQPVPQQQAYLHGESVGHPDRLHERDVGYEVVVLEYAIIPIHTRCHLEGGCGGCSNDEGLLETGA